MGLAITAFAERRAVFDTFVTDAPQEIAHVHRQRARQLGVGHQPLFPNVSRCSTIFSAASSGLMAVVRSEEHTSELQSLMRISYALFCSKTQKNTTVLDIQTITSCSV